MKAIWIALALAGVALVAQPGNAAAQSCRWVGEGEALLCDETEGGRTLSAWEGGGWTSVPAAAGATLPAALGGLSSYGRSYPYSHLTPASSYASTTWLGNSVTQTAVVYGPGNRSRAVTCVSQYWSSSAYRTCR
jgi:hypothetical protein